MSKRSKIVIFAAIMMCTSKIFCADILQADVDAGGGTFTIMNSGTYYLAENINGSIAIDTSDVTLDLAGFTVHTSNSVGISIITSFTGITIVGHGGTVLQDVIGTGTGIDISNGAFSVEILDINVAGWFTGILAGGELTFVQSLLMDRVIADGGLTIQNTFDTSINGSIFLDQPSTNIVIQNCIFNSAAQTGLSLFFCENVYITDSMFNLNSSGDGLSLSNVLEAKIVNCKASASFIGFHIANECFNIELQNCMASSSGVIGYLIQNTNTDIVLQQCEAIENNAIGFDVISCDAVLLKECVATANGDNGFDISSTGTIIIDQCSAQNNFITGFVIQDDTTSGTIKNCISQFNDSSGFDVVSAASLITFLTNRAQGNGSSPAGIPPGFPNPLSDTNYTYSGVGTTFNTPGPGPAPFYQLAQSAVSKQYWDNVTL